MKKIAILVQDMYNEVELWVPYYRLLEEGYDVKLVGAGTQNTYQSKVGLPVTVDVTTAQCVNEDFDGVIIPGGFAPDRIRADKDALAIVKKAAQNGKVVAAICHAGWVLASAGVVKDKKVTCFVNIKDDVINAGGQYVDQEVVVDGNLITSRTPADLPAFCREIVKALRG